MCRHKPDSAIELDESSMIHKKALLVIPDLVSFPLNSLMVLEETQSSVNMFHLSITRSEKKYFLKSVVQLDTVTSCRQIPASLEQ